MLIDEILFILRIVAWAIKTLAQSAPPSNGFLDEKTEEKP